MFPAAALLLAFASDSTPTPRAPSATEVHDAVRRAQALLLAARESYAEGGGRKRPERASAPQPAAQPGPAREWPYEGVYRVAGDIPLGYRVGGTAIAAVALLEAADGAPAGEARAAILGALDFVLEALGDPRLGPEFVQGYDVRGWGHAYALELLLALRAAELVPEERAVAVEAAIDRLVALLAQTEIGERGGWNYSRPQGAASDPSTFMTAPTLLVLFKARAQGEQVDARVVERALATLEAARQDSGAIQYATRAERGKGPRPEAVPGAVGRMAVCEVALHLAGRGSVERIRGAVSAFFEHWQWLEQRRKQTGTHVPPYGIAPYYFFFAHRHVAQAIEFLPEAEREGWRTRLHALLWQVREESGGWNDRVFPRSESFGTAMTVLALVEPHRPRPAGWSSAAPAAGPAQEK
ncbi:MAG: hypothetical protein JNK02_14955 [Planctomycetes bacterium]|nr:hypothetical protein [Planctomycetota bacterium]